MLIDCLGFQVSDEYKVFKLETEKALASVDDIKR